MVAPVLQFKRGNAGVAGTVPALRPGEPAISLNNFDFFIGIDTSVANNKFFGSHRYWGREDGTNSLRLKLVDKNGSNYISIKSPNTLSGIVTYTLPGTNGAPVSVLTNDGSGNLTWSSGSANPVFTGIASFTDTTDNTLGNPNTGAVQIDGGVGIAKNLTVGVGISVGGESYFIGTATANSFISTSTTLQAPTIGNYAGERLRLYDFKDPSNTNYAIGVEGNHIWFGVDNYGDNQGFKWYGETTQVMRLGGTGNLTIEGDLRINGNDIKASDGTTAVSISSVTGNVRSTGDLISGSGYLSSPNGTRSMYMFDTSGDVSFQGKVISNNYRSSTNLSNTLTFSDLDATFARNLTVTGDLYVNGNTTQVNTSELTVYDRTITLGIQTGSTPVTTNWDLGILMNYGDAGTAKTSGVIWEHTAKRFLFSANSDNPASTSSSTPNITVATFAPIEIAELWVNNTCTGGSQQVISCVGAELQLQNITLDAGTF
jgi:hypothetical protein